MCFENCKAYHLEGMSGPMITTSRTLIKSAQELIDWDKNKLTRSDMFLEWKVKNNFCFLSVTTDQ